MKFKSFLIESNETSPYRTTLTKEEALDLIDKHCKKALKEKPIVRGVNNYKNYQLLQGENGKRTARAGGGYYNVAIDHFIEKSNSNFPLRYASIIGTSYACLRYTKVFGDAQLVIFPYDDTKIAVAPKNDLWDIFLEKGLNYDQFSDALSEASVDNSSYEKMITDIASKDWSDTELENLFKGKLTKEEVDEILKEHFDISNNKHLGYKLVDNDSSLLRGEHEFWIGGKCIAIEINYWRDLCTEGYFDGETVVKEHKIEPETWYASSSYYDMPISAYQYDSDEMKKYNLFEIKNHKTSLKLILNELAKNKDNIEKLKPFLKKVSGDTIELEKLVKKDHKLLKDILKVSGYDGIKYMDNHVLMIYIA